MRLFYLVSQRLRLFISWIDYAKAIAIILFNAVITGMVAPCAKFKGIIYRKLPSSVENSCFPFQPD
jgi:hypothetical protein